MTPATVFVSKPAKRAMPWSSWTTMSPVRRSANERSAPRRPAPKSRPGARSWRRRRNRRCSGRIASFRPAAMKPSRRLTCAKRSGFSSSQPAVALPQPRGLQPREVVRRALALAALRPRDDGAVARAHELLELGLGLLQRARGEVRRLGAELQRLVGVVGGQAHVRARVERGADLLGRDVEVVRVGVVEGRADVLPVVGERGADLLLGGEQHGGVRREVEERGEALDRQQLGDVGPVLLGLQRGHLGQLAVLGGELGGGRDLDLLRLAERALGERREPAQRLDLDVEQVDAHRAVLGRRVDVQQPAAGGELAAVLDLVDALVAGGDELGHALLEVEQLADAQLEGVRAQRRVGHLLAQRDGGDDDDGRAVVPRCCSSSRASSAATRRPTRCGGGARCDS